MKLPPPSAFYPELSADRLRVIADALLDLRYETIQQMSTEHDGPYTRETAVFGRSREMLISLARSGKHSWLSLSHAGMDVTINIGAVPCRFFRDDPDHPTKGGFFRRNAADDMFASDDKEPVMWRFVVEMALTDQDEDRVVFAGYNVFQEKVSEWILDVPTPALHSVDEQIPPSTDIPPVRVDVRENKASDSDDNKRSASANE